ncbi:MAG: oligosaccharide flippase family protein [Rhodocyclaceae bacterium]
MLRSLISATPGRLHLYKGVASLFMLRLLQLAMGLAATYFLARSMSKEAFGEYNAALNAIGIVGVTALTGLNNSLMQAVARGHLGTFRAVVPIAFGGSCLGGGLLAIGGWYLADASVTLASGYLFAALLFPFAHGLTQWKSMVVGQERFTSLLYYDGGSSVLTYGLVILSVLYWPGEYIFPIIMTLLVPALYNIVLTAIEYRKVPRDACVEAQNVRYGIRTTLYSGLGAIGANVDRILLFWFMSPVALALFVAAGRIPDLLSAAMQDVAAVIAPRLAKHENYTKRVDWIFSLISMCYGVATIALAFLGIPVLLPLLFGSNYVDAVPYAQALTCSIAIGTLANFRFRYIRSRIDERGFRDITLVSSAVRVVAFLVLVPPFGIVGAVVAMFIYRLSLVLIVRTVIKRHYAV